MIAPKGNPHIPPFSTFPMHRYKPLTSFRAWEAQRDALFPPCHHVGAAQEAAGVSGHGVWLCHCFGCIHGCSSAEHPGGSCGCIAVGKCYPSLSFLLLALILVGSAKTPPGLGMIYNRSNPLGGWVRVCSVLPVIWAVNWNDQGMGTAPALDPWFCCKQRVKCRVRRDKLIALGNLNSLSLFPWVISAVTECSSF